VRGHPEERRMPIQEGFKEGNELGLFPVYSTSNVGKK
jgi:hypothetical protein